MQAILLDLDMMELLGNMCQQYAKHFYLHWPYTSLYHAHLIITFSKRISNCIYQN